MPLMQCGGKLVVVGGKLYDPDNGGDGTHSPCCRADGLFLLPCTGVVSIAGSDPQTGPGNQSPFREVFCPRFNGDYEVVVDQQGSCCGYSMTFTDHFDLTYNATPTLTQRYVADLVLGVSFIVSPGADSRDYFWRVSVGTARVRFDAGFGGGLQPSNVQSGQFGLTDQSTQATSDQDDCGGFVLDQATNSINPVAPAGTCLRDATLTFTPD